MIHELAPETFALPRRVDRNVVEEVGIGFGPGDPITTTRPAATSAAKSATIGAGSRPMRGTYLA